MIFLFYYGPSENAASRVKDPTPGLIENPPAEVLGCGSLPITDSEKSVAISVIIKGVRESPSVPNCLPPIAHPPKVDLRQVLGVFSKELSVKLLSSLIIMIFIVTQGVVVLNPVQLRTEQPEDQLRNFLIIVMIIMIRRRRMAMMTLMMMRRRRTNMLMIVIAMLVQ